MAMRMAELAGEDRHYQVHDEGRDNLAYAVPVLEPLGWLAGLDFVYWVDVDMHGFVILNRLRHHLPHARSMLMDRATLLGRREHWATKPSPAAAALDRLDRAESALYADLILNAHAPSVRLEQDRISFSAIEKAVAGRTTVMPGTYGQK